MTHRLAEFAAAFVLTAAGVAAAVAIIWRTESRLIERALSLPAVTR